MVIILIVLKKLCFFQNGEPKMEKKQIRVIFIFQFKLDRKAAETARDINQAFGIGTTTERTSTVVV